MTDPAGATHLGCPECGRRIRYDAPFAFWWCLSTLCPWGEQGEAWLGETLYAADEWADVGHEAHVSP